MKYSIKYAVLPGLALALVGASIVSAQTTSETAANTINTEVATTQSFRTGKVMHNGFMMFNGGDPEEFASQQTKMFNEQAEVTGLSVDEIKQAWSEGKELPELLKEKGIDMETVRTKMKAKAEENMKTHIQLLVEKGIITQAQANARIEFMKNKKMEFLAKPGVVEKFKQRMEKRHQPETSENS